MKCQTEMSRGPLAEDEHSRKGMVGGPPAGRPPPFLFWRGRPLPSPLHLRLHFRRRSMVNHHCFCNANANINANGNANAMAMFGHALLFSFGAIDSLFSGVRLLIHQISHARICAQGSCITRRP